MIRWPAVFWRRSRHGRGHHPARDEEIKTIWPEVRGQGGATVSDGDSGDDANSSDSGSDGGDDSDASDSGGDSDSDSGNSGDDSDSSDR